MSSIDDSRVVIVLESSPSKIDYFYVEFFWNHVWRRSYLRYIRRIVTSKNISLHFHMLRYLLRITQILILILHKQNILRLQICMRQMYRMQEHKRLQYLLSKYFYMVKWKPSVLVLLDEIKQAFPEGFKHNAKGFIISMFVIVKIFSKFDDVWTFPSFFFYSL